MSALPRQAEPFRGGAFRHVQFVASRAGPEIASVYASALLPSSRVFVGEALARLFDRLGREAIRKPDNDRLCRPINHVGGNKILEAVRRAIAKVGPLGETVHDAIVSHHTPRVSRLLLLAVVLYAEKLLAEAEHLIERADERVGGIVRRMSTLGESEASERALPLDNFCIEVFIALRLCAIQDPLAILDR
jgi:hypothetical protein